MLWLLRIFILLLPAILLCLLAVYLFVNFDQPIQFAPPRTYGAPN